MRVKLWFYLHVYVCVHIIHTDCDTNELVSDAAPQESDECEDGQMGLFLPMKGSSSQSGKVCYNGTTFNSTASYMASSGCVTRGGSTGPRRCTSSGQWSGELPVVECRGEWQRCIH